MKNNNLPNGAKREFNVTKFGTTITILSPTTARDGKGEHFNVGERGSVLYFVRIYCNNCN